MSKIELVGTNLFRYDMPGYPKVLIYLGSQDGVVYVARDVTTWYGNTFALSSGAIREFVSDWYNPDHFDWLGPFADDVEPGKDEEATEALMAKYGMDSDKLHDQVVALRGEQLREALDASRDEVAHLIMKLYNLEGAVSGAVEETINNLKTTAGLLVVRDNRVLLVNNGGELWGIPKGQVEDDEPLDQAAYRETKEETGVAGKIVGALGAVHTHQENLYAFLAKYESGGTITAGGWVLSGDGENQLARFMNPGEAMEKISPMQKIFLQRAIAGNTMSIKEQEALRNTANTLIDTMVCALLGDNNA